MILLAGTMLLVAISGILMFRGNILTGILMILCAGAILAVYFYFASKWKKGIKYAVYAACFLIYAFCAFLGNGRISDYGFDAYGIQVSKISDELEEGNYRKALPMIQKLQEEFGNSDVLSLMEARALIETGETGRGMQSLGKMEEKDSASYYLYYAAAYEKEERYDEELKVLVEGAKKNPENYLLNYRTGCLAAWKEDFVTADYYLSCALNFNYDENCFAPYMLASVRYQEGKEGDAYALMAYAEEKGILKESEYAQEEVVKWYLERKGARENE